MVTFRLRQRRQEIDVSVKSTEVTAYSPDEFRGKPLTICACSLWQDADGVKAAKGKTE